MKRANPQKLTKKSLATQLAELLEKAIADGVWHVGDRIPSEGELAESYGVSRNTLREAVHYLVIAGVLDVRPGDGTYVTSRTAFDATMQRRIAAADLANIIEVRRIIEPELCAMAASRRTDEEMACLEEKHKRLIDSYNGQKTDYIDTDIDFHLYIAQLSHNPLLYDLYKAVISQYPLFVKDGFLSFVASENKDIYLHMDLVKYIKEKDAAAVKKLTKKMIESEAEDLDL